MSDKKKPAPAKLPRQNDNVVPSAGPSFKDQARSAADRPMPANNLQHRYLPEYKDQVNNLPFPGYADFPDHLSPKVDKAQSPDNPTITPIAFQVENVEDSLQNNSRNNTTKHLLIRSCAAVIIAFVVVVGVVVAVLLGTGGGSDDKPSTVDQAGMSQPPSSDLVGMSPVSAPQKESFRTTEELYRAVDLYMTDKSLTLEYGATIGDWDVSRIKVFDRLFDANRNQSSLCSWQSDCLISSFNEEINSWNTSSAESMVAMFLNARQFNGNISSWDVSHVTDMSWMFAFATEFDQDLMNWNVGMVTNMESMFRAADTFDHPIGSLEC